MSCEERCEPSEHANSRPRAARHPRFRRGLVRLSDVLRRPVWTFQAAKTLQWKTHRRTHAILDQVQWPSMPGFLTEMGPLGPSVGSIERCKTVQKWMWYDPRERNPVEPHTSDVLPTSPRTHTVPGTAGDGHNGEPLQCFGKNPDFTGQIH